jgi:hypothetical protein
VAKHQIGAESDFGAGRIYAFASQRQCRSQAAPVIAKQIAATYRHRSASTVR